MSITRDVVVCFLIVFISALVQGCSTLGDAAYGGKTGEERLYQASFETVWDAALSIVKESDLELVYADKTKGLMLAQRGLTVSQITLGENVALFVEKAGSGKIRIESVTRRALFYNFTAADWTEKILKRMDGQLWRDAFKPIKRSPYIVDPIT